LILLVDGTNQFIRHYVVYSSTDINGNPFGGVVGFLRSLGSIVSLTKPTKVVIAFDAPGGSQRRRAICREYKEGRKPSRLNRKFDIGDDKEQNNKKAQEQYLREYLKDLPVSVICINNIEADDVLAYLCLLNPNERKVIVSSDHDFYQLLDANTLIYQPSKKNFYTLKDCTRENGIYPINFALARAFTGDSSDNLKGIPGIGLKTLLKLVPQFGQPEELSAQEVFDFCSQQEGKKYPLFAEHKQRVLDNYSVMRLRDPIISLASATQIKSSIQESASMNATGLRIKLMRDGIDIGNNFLQSFLTLSLAGKNK
jgi:DNA polymerase-1